MTLYYAYVKERPTAFYISLALIGFGLIGVIAFFLAASFAGKNRIQRIWFANYLEYLKYLSDREEAPKKDIDYKACLEAVRQRYLSDTNKDKNKIEKLKTVNDKRLYDYSVLESGKIYYASMVMANDRLFHISRFIHKTHPAVFVYSTDAYFEENPRELIKIAKKAVENGLNGLLYNESKFFTNVKFCSEFTDNREVYFSCCLVCRRQLPFGMLNGRIVPLIANPEKNCSVFVADCKYWTGEFIYLYLGCEEKDTYGDPFKI